MGLPSQALPQAPSSQAIPMSVILDEIVVGVESGLGAGDRVDETPGVDRIAQKVVGLLERLVFGV